MKQKFILECRLNQDERNTNKSFPVILILAAVLQLRARAQQLS
jgi:hypothetical protein